MLGSSAAQLIVIVAHKSWNIVWDDPSGAREGMPGLGCVVKPASHTGRYWSRLPSIIGHPCIFPGVVCAGVSKAATRRLYLVCTTRRTTRLADATSTRVLTGVRSSPSHIRVRKSSNWSSDRAQAASQSGHSGKENERRIATIM